MEEISLSLFLSLSLSLSLTDDNDNGDYNDEGYYHYRFAVIFLTPDRSNNVKDDPEINNTNKNDFKTLRSAQERESARSSARVRARACMCGWVCVCVIKNATTSTTRNLFNEAKAKCRIY